jgi:hypothetical protein
MVRHSKWERDIDNKADKQQIKFDASGKMVQPKPAEITQFTAVNCNQPVMCPFCLYQAKLSSFFISNKKGISQGRAECPECHNGMLMKSLWADMNAKEYAKWVFDYRVNGFWQKCPFATWKKRLHDIGWSYDFWNTYKGLKGIDSANETFEEADDRAKYYADKANEYEAQFK